MENWGCILCKHSIVLYDPYKIDLEELQSNVTTLCHEIAHMWFGNLVTMEWWNDLWLNEGFAELFSFISIDSIFPEYNIWNYFIEDVFLESIKVDKLPNTHPIIRPIQTSYEMDEMFDEICYSKGASVIYQLSKLVGDDLFNKALKEYLNKYRYSNARSEDLWKVFEEVTNIEVKGLMNYWCTTSGHPLINVTLSEDNKFFIVSQNADYEGDYSSNSIKCWPINLSFLTSESPKSQTIFFTNQQIQIKSNNAKWIFINHNFSSLCNVKYSQALLENLFLDFGNIGKLNQVLLISILSKKIDALSLEKVVLPKLNLLLDTSSFAIYMYLNRLIKILFSNNEAEKALLIIKQFQECISSKISNSNDSIFNCGNNLEKIIICNFICKWMSFNNTDKQLENWALLKYQEYEQTNWSEIYMSLKKSIIIFSIRADKNLFEIMKDKFCGYINEIPVLNKNEYYYDTVRKRINYVNYSLIYLQYLCSKYEYEDDREAKLIIQYILIYGGRDIVLKSFALYEKCANLIKEGSLIGIEMQKKNFLHLFSPKLVEIYETYHSIKH